MADDTKKKVTGETKQGVIGQEEKGFSVEVHVAPSTKKDKKLNVIRLKNQVMACWRMRDICFDFDQAFVKADSDTVREFDDFIENYKKLRDKYKANSRFKGNPAPPITIFGHADPVGEFDYNKKLSEKRAKAVYGVLLQSPAEWREIFKKDDEIRYLQESLRDSGSDPGGIDGDFGPLTEAAVKAHMKTLCPNFKLEEKDFLGEGKYPYQGCSEFNPILVFSKEEEESYAKDKPKRNEENEPNRRIVAYLFEPGAKVGAGKWPCPKAPEWKKCKLRFWSDSEKRLSNQKSRRNYWTTRDTFACRFYDRIARTMTCEGPMPPIIKEEIWKITLIGSETFDMYQAEAHREIREIMRQKYPPKHSERINLHVQSGMQVEYKFEMEFVIRKRQGGDWYCRSGEIKSVQVTGYAKKHPAWKDYYSTISKVNRAKTTVGLDHVGNVYSMIGSEKIKSLVNKSVGLEFVTEQMDVERQYSILSTRKKLGQQPKGGGLVFDYYNSFYRPLRGRDLKRYPKYRHVKIKWPSMNPVRVESYNTFSGKKRLVQHTLKTVDPNTISTIEMADPRFNVFLADRDHMLPLKTMEDFVFNNVSGDNLHQPKYRDKPYYYVTYEYFIKLLSSRSP